MPIKPINTGNRWSEVLQAVEIPSTRMLLENHVVKAFYVGLAGTYCIHVERIWKGMFQSRHELIHRAVKTVFGEGTLLRIEAADQQAPLDIFTDQELVDELARRLREVQS